MPKTFKAFRFNPQLYASFKQLASKAGYTVTGAFEEFMRRSVEYGLVFPQPGAKTEDFEAEARIVLAWLKKGKFWVSLEAGEEQTSTKGRLLQLLPKIQDLELKKEIEEALKKK